MGRRTATDRLEHHQAQAHRLAQQLATKLTPIVGEVSAIIRRIDKLRETNGDGELGTAAAALKVLHARWLDEAMHSQGLTTKGKLRQQVIGEDDPFGKVGT